MDERRVTDEELSALFEGGVPAAEPASGLPPRVVPPLAALCERLLVGSFLDLDDFLEIPLESSAPLVAATPPQDLVRLARGGAWALLSLSGAVQGRIWLVLPEVSVRRLLARLLGSRDDQVTGVLGRLHRTSLEAPIEEVRNALARHLEDEEIRAVVAHEAPCFEAPEAPEAERLVRLECSFEMRDSSLAVAFYLEEALALALAELERGRIAAEAPEEPEPEVACDDEDDEEDDVALEEDFEDDPEEGADSEDDSDDDSDDDPEDDSDDDSDDDLTAAPAAAAPRAPGRDGAAAPPAGVVASGPVTLRAYLGEVGLAGGVAGLEEGMVLRLDRLAGELVELRVGDAVVGEARVTVVDGHYGLEIRRLRRGEERP